jgi:hypothetical protein
VPGPQAVHVAPGTVELDAKPAVHKPAVEPPHPMLFGEHFTQAELSTLVLYLPAVQALQVTPESVEPYPGSQLPADVPPQPVSFGEHSVHAVLPGVVLYLPVSQGVHVAPPSVVVYPAIHFPGLVVPVFVPHPVLYGEHTKQAELSAVVLYVPVAQAVQVFPESVEPYPGAQLPADEPPQPF